MKYLKDLSFNGKRVLIRADLNVPLNEQREISDENRIKQFIPTLKYILEQGGKPVVMSHLGSPEGKVVPQESLKPVAAKITQLLKAQGLNVSVILAPDCIGSAIEQMSLKLESNQVLLLENLRFHAGEEANDPEFCRQLSKLGDVFVNDAFATAHRKHASMVGVPKLFTQKAAGLLMQQEMQYYERALVSPKKPLCVILGGAKVSSKLNALMNLAHRADKLIIGGAMANTFLAAQGIQMGRSLVERDLFPKVLELLVALARKDCKVYLPVDLLVTPSMNSVGLSRPVPVQEIPADQMAVDIGPATSLLYREVLTNSETVVWNGPMGAFEKEEFAKGTTDLIEGLASSHALTVVGGGDTDSAIHQMQLAHKFGFISTGGGAFLVLLEGKGLPGFSALEA